MFVKGWVGPFGAAVPGVRGDVPDGLPLGCGQDREGPLQMERKLLLGHAQQVTGEAGDGRRIDSRPAGSRQPNRGSGRPRSLALAAGRAEVGVDLAGDVTLQAADDLRLGFPFGRAALGVGAGGRVRAQAGEHDPP
jgi:hypothetical protein